jgi:hypothetical protein
MFYKKEEVDSALMCLICSEIFQDNDPRMLPCGESACHRCIHDAIDVDNNCFKCCFCNEKHKPASGKGFPPNRAILRLFEAKADQVYRNSNVERLLLKLAEVKKESDQFKADISNGTDQIKEHCLQLRNQVHLQTDILLEEVHQFNENMISEIDKYEVQYVISFSNKFVVFEKEGVEFLTQIDDFHNENLKYLTEFKIDDKRIDDGLALADNYLLKI